MGKYLCNDYRNHFNVQQNDLREWKKEKKTKRALNVRCQCAYMVYVHVMGKRFNTERQLHRFFFFSLDFSNVFYFNAYFILFYFSICWHSDLEILQM